MQEIHIPHPQKKMYLVSDCHLDNSVAPYAEFIQMINGLEDMEALVCLGDLFKVWLALPKFWAPLHREVMECFAALREKSVKIIFVWGNREGLLPRNPQQLRDSDFPFDEIVPENAILTWGNLRYGLIHGDTLNPDDLNYLRWRKITRSRLFEGLFRLMPAPLARHIATKLEATLAKTNQEFKMSFPRAAVEAFAQQVLPTVDGYFVGHFHQDHTIGLADGYSIPTVTTMSVPAAVAIHQEATGCLDNARDNTNTATNNNGASCSGHGAKLRVVPDWMTQKAVLKISPDGQVATLYYDPHKKQLVEKRPNPLKHSIVS